MYKKYHKKAIAILTVVVSTFAFISFVFASVSFRFYNTGDSKQYDSDSKMSGTIGVKAVHYSQYYDGKLEYTLKKKWLLGYSKVGSSQTKSTYGTTTDIAYWSGCSNAKYRGIIELTKADSNYSNIYGNLSLT